MALSRLGNTRRSENFTWPGFVDALATLLMVIIFVLMVFVLIQANLAYRVSGQDATLGEMRQQLASLSELLNIERRASADLAADLAQLQIQLETSKTDRSTLAAQLAAVQATLGTRNSELTALSAKQAETEAALKAARDALDERLRALQMVEGQLALTEARNRTQQQTMRDLEAETTASKAEVTQMTLVLAGLRQRIEELTSLLAEKDRQAEEDKVAIASLGKSLNNALASRVQELQQFRSEFFGRLRDVLKGRDDVQIVGDRFVFQSEVLFAPGQADIGPTGQDQLAQLAVALADIAAKIPDDINWVLQVDGHTDNLPVRAGRYTDNWDLSTERALSVVRFLVMQGVPAQRLAATGYGEFQPLASGDTAADRRLNRRIELKITQRVAAK
ncbi:MAG: peptidoglycan-binding protein [Proteobacteria bacterium]|nr:peptidoglycan-binding protein [Pseudomonadota bacterium]MDA0844663.1 peptidoglycan-binding protein [Pseudomonadota bacterium]